MAAQPRCRRRMNCPYHPKEDAALEVPAGLQDGGGWVGWLDGCCGLPAWRCEQGALLPMEARFCVYHGCSRPRLDRVVHEVAAGSGLYRGARQPALIQRALELGPNPDGASSPCLAGNVLVYLTENGRLLAVDVGGDAAIFLAAQVRAASLRVDAGRVVGALRTGAGVRYLAWDVRDLRDALREGETVVPPTPAPGTHVHLLGLPRDEGALHRGSGLLRLEVWWDPVPDEVSTLYQRVTGTAPGPWRIHRVTNPLGPEVHHPDMRPQVLHQVPVPIPGGVLLLGQLRWLGHTAAGALLVPTVGGRRVAA